MRKDVQQELDLDLQLRQSFAEASEKLAGLLKDKEQLESASKQSIESTAKLQEKIESLGTTVNDLQIQKAILLSFP